MFVEMCSNDCDCTQESDFGFVFHNRCIINGLLEFKTRVFTSIPTNVNVSKNQNTELSAIIMVYIYNCNYKSYDWLEYLPSVTETAKL